MSFKDIYGHKRQIEFLRKAIENDYLSHGYVFEGEKGLGKKLVSNEFIKGIFCLEHVSDPCGICSNCLKLDSGNHPDYLLIEPEGASIKNKQVEEIQSFISIKPYESSVKVVVVDDCNTMTISAQNRLLKVLEEPSGDVMMILLSENVEALLPTIKSRLQRMRFSKLSKVELTDFAKARFDLSEEDLEAITIFSEGSVGKMVSFVDSEVFKEGRKKVFQLAEAMHKKELFRMFQLGEYFVEDKDNIMQLLDFMIMLYRDILLYSETRNSSLIINSDIKNDIMTLSGLVTTKKVLIYIDYIEACKSAIRSNTNVVVAFETLLFNIQEA